MTNVIIETLLGARLAGEILLQVKSHKVEHVPQVGVVCMLHEDLAQTLYEPGALCAVPVSHIAGKGGVCDENVLPAKLLSNHRDYHQNATG